ncbi:hypothetical protein PMALA_064830 [Plasmodium malariae]|uniref:Uncharacterized protein n=1 Tax=Plasmodium malariae TaxID=5858 RepID=A0A1A8X0J4_PLAMA|nr:hypothetical protein PMALA_064830 [Plasmodium malariae]
MDFPRCSCDISTESVNNTKYHNHKFDLGMRRFFLGPMYYKGNESRLKHYKKFCFSRLFGCYDTSKYQDIILKFYNTTVSHDYIIKSYKELKEEAMQFEGYKLREKEIEKYINDLLYYLELKYKKKVETTPFPKNQKYEKLLQIVSSPKTKSLLRLTIPSLAESYYLFSYIPHIYHSIDESILCELIKLAKRILYLHNNN